MRAILFDLDDTLIVDEQAAVEAFLAVGEVLRQYGIDPETFHQTIRRCARTVWHQSPARKWCLAVGISSWEGLWADFQGDQPEARLLQLWSPQYRHSSWTATLRELGIDDDELADQLAAMFITERDRRHLLFPDVLPALGSLTAVHRLGIVTNGLSSHQWRKLKGVGLEDYFQTVVISGDRGIGKPDPGIFSEALSLLGVEAHEACMVGDSLSSDIAGARASGIRAVWINRDNRPLPGDITPDAVITSLDQLPELIGRSSP